MKSRQMEKELVQPMRFRFNRGLNPLASKRKRDHGPRSFPEVECRGLFIVPTFGLTLVIPEFEVRVGSAQSLFDRLPRYSEVIPWKW